METIIFEVFDKVSCQVALVGLAATAGAFVRDVGPWFHGKNIDDFILYEVGKIGTDGISFDVHSPILTSWDVYKHPETKAVEISAPSVEK